MNTISVISQKGGVGKTTIALYLAVAAMLEGKLAAVLDVDPQSTASRWTDLRRKETPWVVPTHAIRLKAALQKAESEGVDLIVIDTPPHSATDAAEAARQSNLVIIPVEPHVFALDTLEKAGDLLKLAGNPQCIVVINKAPVQGSEATSAMNYISGLGFRACPIVMHLRAAHRHAANVGKVAVEFESTGKAAEESKDLYNYVLAALTKKGKKYA